jgi:hypothetical protein
MSKITFERRTIFSREIFLKKKLVRNSKIVALSLMITLLKTSRGAENFWNSGT